MSSQRLEIQLGEILELLKEWPELPRQSEKPLSKYLGNEQEWPLGRQHVQRSTYRTFKEG